MRNIILFVCLITITLACNNISVDTGEIEKVKYTLDIYDSVAIEDYTGRWVITDATDSFLLGFDVLLNNVVLINRSSLEVTIIDKKGNGPGEFNVIKGLSFFNDSTFMVLGGNNLLFYKLPDLFCITYPIMLYTEGGIIGWNFKFNIPSYISNFDTNVIVRPYNTNYVSNNLNNVEWFTKINLSKKTSNKIVPFQEQNYLLRNPKSTFPSVVPLFDVSSTNKLVVEYPYEEFIEIYDISQGYKYEESIDLYPSRFSPKVKSKSMEDANKHFLIEQQNSMFDRLLVIPEGVIIEYHTSINASKIVKTRAELIEQDGYKRYRDRYMIFSDWNGSISEEIPMKWQENKLTAVFALSSNEIFFKKMNPNDIGEEDRFVLLIGKIKAKFDE